MTNEQLTEKTMHQAEAIARLRSDCDGLDDRLTQCEKRIEAHDGLIVSMEKLTGRIVSLENKLGEILGNKKQAIQSILSIVTSVATAAILVWLGLKG